MSTKKTHEYPVLEKALAFAGEGATWEYVGDRWGNEYQAAITLEEVMEMLESLDWEEGSLVFFQHGIRGDSRPRIAERDTRNDVLILNKA